MERWSLADAFILTYTPTALGYYGLSLGEPLVNAKRIQFARKGLCLHWFSFEINVGGEGFEPPTSSV